MPTPDQPFAIDDLPEDERRQLDLSRKIAVVRASLGIVPRALARPDHIYARSRDGHRVYLGDDVNLVCDREWWAAVAGTVGAVRFPELIAGRWTKRKANRLRRHLFAIENGLDPDARLSRHDRALLANIA